MQQQQTTKLDELLNDEDSDVARYLLSGNKPKSCFARCRKGSSSDAADDDNEEDNIRSMGKFNTDAYSLSLEPIEIRSEKIIMLAEGEICFAYGMFDLHISYGTSSYRLRHSKCINSIFDCKYICIDLNILNSESTSHIILFVLS